MRPEFFSLPRARRPAASAGLRRLAGRAHLQPDACPQIVPALLDAVPGLTILHQCGARHVESTHAAYAATGADPARWQVEPFLDDMPARFAQAHLVMARSGASTVAELAAAGKPSLLIPFAAAADNHQKRNAEEMVKAGAAVMLGESDLAGGNSTKLLEALTVLLNAPKTLGDHGLRRPHPGASGRRRAHRRQVGGVGVRICVGLESAFLGMTKGVENVVLCDRAVQPSRSGPKEARLQKQAGQSQGAG